MLRQQRRKRVVTGLQAVLSMAGGGCGCRSGGRGLHSFTLELNLSNSCHIHVLTWIKLWTKELQLS